MGELTYNEARDTIDHICEGMNQYNGIIMWELQMIQNFDKVIKYDDNVSFFNIEIHKQCHMQHMFWVKMVRF